ncbi:hypothetical protein K7X08_019482 [Anisodus acutangulus]|uniref:Uncharacterized protein n=1 Tax=Anisodus acutangulus TaxID=402998 RepID=A0A9Q1MSL9_9SOLA|nr:hypothetical protein K7X08_019482 [Anisodus acutangulus]
MPIIKSIGERMIPPIYNIEMDAATFRDFGSHGWHIEVLQKGDKNKKTMQQTQHFSSGSSHVDNAPKI